MPLCIILDMIQQLDVDDFFKQSNSTSTSPPNRHFGIYAIVELMKQQTAQLQGL